MIIMSVSRVMEREVKSVTPQLQTMSGVHVINLPRRPTERICIELRDVDVKSEPEICDGIQHVVIRRCDDIPVQARGSSMKGDEKKRLNEGDEDAAVYDVSDESLDQGIRTASCQLYLPLQCLGTYPLMPVRADASNAPIAMVATTSVIAPNPFAKPKKT